MMVVVHRYNKKSRNTLFLLLYEPHLFNVWLRQTDRCFLTCKQSFFSQAGEQNALPNNEADCPVRSMTNKPLGGFRHFRSLLMPP